MAIHTSLRKNREKMLYLDYINYNFTFRPIEKNEACSSNSYKIAMAIAPNRDYHFYRQNSDGTWSHKRGVTAVIDYDNSEETIYDPETCDRNYNSNYNYSVFCGFYEVCVSSINVNIYV